MSRRDELNSYIAQTRSRLRLQAWTAGFLVLAGTALLTTIVLVLILNHYAFPAVGVKGARVALFVLLGVTAAAGIALPLMRLTPERTVAKTEQAHAELEQRLRTFYERQQQGGDPFIELLAADTLTHTQDAAPSSLAPGRRLFAFAGVGLGCLGALIWMIVASRGFIGYGATLLWTGGHKNAAPLYSLAVEPGDVTVRRNSDQLITAHVVGLHPEKVQLFAHYQSAKGWEPVAMQMLPDQGGSASYQFVLAGLPENVEYYVTAGPLSSQHYTVRVADLPTVKKIHVTYQFPKWTGLKPAEQEQSGDLRAIEGTDASIEVEMDKPLKEGKLALDDNKTITLSSGEGNTYKGSIHMEKDGAYHVAAIEQGQPVRLSEDYFIATDKAEPPQVSISRPGGDYRASPIEEVKVGVEAADQFGLREMHLHYSVNGGADKDVDLLKSPGAKNADGSYTLRLEEFKLVPGDLVSLYATAKDGHAEARTDISFVQVDPFEREFSQSQQSGGGGGGGGGGQSNQTDMSKREKELIAATWKQQNDKTATQKDSAVQGQFLSDAQQKLRDQVQALSARMQSRDLSEANEEFNGFERDMQMAAAAMGPSADKLKGMQWKDALPLEQKALQALLRAEATFRQIQVAFGQQGGGGGGANSAGRDLASLFDLELDTAKNQYETAQNTSPEEQKQKEIDDVLAKLDALAKRQEELAKQQNNPQQSFQDRWQQEMLRREAEQLQRQMEQMAQNGNGQQSGSPQSGSQQSGSQQTGSQQSGSQSSGASGSSQSGSQQQRSASAASGSSASGRQQDQRVEQALSRLRQAGDAMKRSGNPQQSADAARQAADRLEEARGLLGASRQQMASGKLGSLSQEADRLAQEERSQTDRINEFANRQQGANPLDRDSVTARLNERNRLAEDRQQLSNDLSSLQRNMRDSARSMASNSPSAAEKLRRALSEMDESDLDNHVQRTADWLRRGINPNSNGTEAEIAQGLQKLSGQLRDAQKDAGQAAPGGRRDGAGRGDQTAALDQVRRLRGQLEAMAGPAGDRQGANRQGNQRGQGSADGRDPSQSANGQIQRGGQGQQGQQAGTRSGQGQQAGNRTGQAGDANGEIRAGGGGYADGTVWGNINTGNNSYGAGSSRPAPTDASGNPRDTEQTYRQQMRELERLRQMVQGDSGASKEVSELTKQMQALDPSRFPGNPAMVEHLHREALSAIDRLELQLKNGGATAEARSGKPDTVPSGYQEPVAEYYRRLSKAR
ncbi:MAG: hypothetical protein JSS95_17080 [Acidobacteria bacterium]|nr:hypothetical protein [Acidobacteriota bacterium]